MLMEQSIEKMHKMKLHKMAESFKEKLSAPQYKDLSHEEFLGILIDDEYLDRKNKKLASRLRLAKFKEQEACVENINYKWDRGLNKKDFLGLVQNHWIENYQNIAFIGPSGVGKSYLAQALGNNACKAGYPVIYEKVSRLLQRLKIAKADGTYTKLLDKIKKQRVLILDDFAMIKIDSEGIQDLFEIVEDRYAQGSTLITAQLSKANWHEALGGGILADGVVIGFITTVIFLSYREILTGKNYLINWGQF